VLHRILRRGSSRRTRSRRSFGAVLALIGATLAPHNAAAQLTLEAARATAHLVSPELRAAREAVSAAAARERQAGAYANPTLAYGLERTSRAGETNAQAIAQVEQQLEIGGQRAARREVARLRRDDASTRLSLVAARLDFDVASAFARAVAAEQRERLAEQTSVALAEARRVSEQRLAAGDVSGYVARRLRLEAGRFAAIRAAATMDRHATRRALATLLGLSGTAGDTITLPNAPPIIADSSAAAAVDSLIERAIRSRPELRLAALDVATAAAEEQLVARERVPTPTLSAGYKGERVADPARGSLTGFRGIVAGLSIPLPLFDRRVGAIEAAAADTRRVRAEGDIVRRRVTEEVVDALQGLRTVEAQRAALAPHLGEQAQIAVRAVHASYAEGEITLVEWLDAVRAYQEAESMYVSLQAEVAVRKAALARAVGAPLFPSPTSDR